MRRVLVVDDEENLRLVLRTLLRRHGYEVETADSGEEALALVDSFGPDFVLTDVRMPKMGGLDLLATLKAKGNDATVIVMSAYGNIDLAIEAMKARRLRLRAEAVQARRGGAHAAQGGGARALAPREPRAARGDPQGEQVRGHPGQEPEHAGDLPHHRQGRRLQDHGAHHGESGVGKELVARAIHARSSRRDGPVRAGQLRRHPREPARERAVRPQEGRVHRRVQDRRGLFEEADGGTLFLDEIGELPLALQVKLLRVLEDEKIRRLGETRDIKVDVRIIAATHRDLQAETKAGRFREDLFYRLNVLPIHVPPLRERREDIPLLDRALHHPQQRAARHAHPRAWTPRRAACSYEYPWPGNVRELENTIERAMVLAEGDHIVAARSARAHPRGSRPGPAAARERRAQRQEDHAGHRGDADPPRPAEDQGQPHRAAEVLEISHRALLYKIKDYQITDL